MIIFCSFRPFWKCGNPKWRSIPNCPLSTYSTQCCWLKQFFQINGNLIISHSRHLAAPFQNPQLTLLRPLWLRQKAVNDVSEKRVLPLHPLMYLEPVLKINDAMHHSIINQIMEMNTDNPFRESNSRSTRIRVNQLLKIVSANRWSYAAIDTSIFRLEIQIISRIWDLSFTDSKQWKKFIKIKWCLIIAHKFIRILLKREMTIITSNRAE